MQHLKISRVLGSAKERLEALREDADVYVINRENVVWLVENHKWNFDMVVVDELSSFKNNQAKRFKALRKMIPLADRFVGLTGTPAPNGMIDLWPQLYLIDRGERLGKTITCYRQRYFFPAKGPVVYTWELKPGSAEAITKKISDVCISMKAEDYLTMPELTVNDIKVKLAPAEEARYRELERQRILELEGETITAVTAAAACNKLLQMADGCVYDAAGVPVKIHERKLDALADILEFSQGQPVLVFYNYRFELDQLRERFGATRTIQGQQDIRDWNTGRIPLLLAQPASMGHGLNLQAGGHIIVWYGLTWSLELYQQANARLYRQGQQEAVVIHRLIAAGTMDEDWKAKRWARRACWRLSRPEYGGIRMLHIKTPNGRMDINLPEFIRRSGPADCRRLMKLIRRGGDEALMAALREDLAAEEDQANRDEDRIQEISRLITKLRAEKAAIANPTKRRKVIKILKEEMER